MIQIENISKSYDGTKAVKDLSLEIPAGQLFGFLGPNGAGKTTTLKMVAGLLRPDGGRVLINGTDIQQKPEQAKQIIGYIPDAPYLYEKLSGYEFLQFIGMLYNVSAAELKQEFIQYRDIFGFGKWIHDRIETYSHGMRQKVVFTAAFIHKPQLLIVDEPMVGLDPGSIRIVKQLLIEKCQAGMTVFMSTHTLGIAQEICQRVAIIHKGEVISIGTFEALRSVADSAGDLEEVFLTLISEQDNR